VADSFGFIHSVIAPIFRKIEPGERPGWDRSKKRPDARTRRLKDGDNAPADQDDRPDGEEGVSSTHIDVRI
jgi:hypothetical protein